MPISGCSFYTCFRPLLRWTHILFFRLVYTCNTTEVLEPYFITCVTQREWGSAFTFPSSMFIGQSLLCLHLSRSFSLGYSSCPSPVYRRPTERGVSSRSWSCSLRLSGAKMHRLQEVVKDGELFQVPPQWGSLAGSGVLGSQNFRSAKRQ